MRMYVCVCVQLCDVWVCADVCVCVCWVCMLCVCMSDVGVDVGCLCGMHVCML